MAEEERYWTGLAAGIGRWDQATVRSYGINNVGSLNVRRVVPL